MGRLQLERIALHLSRHTSILKHFRRLQEAIRIVGLNGASTLECEVLDLILPF